MKNKSPSGAPNQIKIPNNVIARDEFELLLHKDTFGPGSQYAFNKFRHEQIKEEMLDSAIYESLGDNQIAISSAE